MRIFEIACATCVLFSPVAEAADLIAVKPGVMCRDAGALAKLTLPDGSSRSASAGARAADLAVKAEGGCIDIPPGARVVLQTARKRTSVVLYDAQDGRGAGIFLVPNIDFRRETDGAREAGAPPQPGSAASPAGRFIAAVEHQCPQQGWTEYALSHEERGPTDAVYAAMTPAQQAAAQKTADKDCQDVAGQSCPADAIFGYMVEAGYLTRMVRAVCAVKAPME